MILDGNEYAAILASAIKRYPARNYSITRLKQSLENIGIYHRCVDDIITLLLSLSTRPSIDSSELLKMVNHFRSKWQVHLQRAYFEGYEDTRLGFVHKYVLDEVVKINKKIGKCLDIGCGRGCITESIVTKGYSSDVFGLDAVDFRGEWQEREANPLVSQNGLLHFDCKPISEIGAWLDGLGEFDTILLLYVLHHSTDYWVIRTLEKVRHALSKNGIIAILEDSFITDTDNLFDVPKIIPTWKQWISSDKPYCSSISYDVQIILDFVAVQLLAGFKEVSMPCNYKLGNEWEDIFAQSGFEIIHRLPLGFPPARDIDVPQSVFFLKL